MSTLLWLKWKIEGPLYRLRSDERLRYQVARWGWQVAESRTTAGRNESYLSCTSILNASWLKTDPLSHTYQHHWVFSVEYYVHCSYDDSSMYRFRRDNDCVVWFTEQLRDLAHSVNCILSANVLMVDFDYEKLNSATLSRAKNRSRQTTRECAIIAIWLVNTKVPPIRIAI